MAPTFPPLIDLRGMAMRIEMTGRRGISKEEKKNTGLLNYTGVIVTEIVVAYPAPSFSVLMTILQFCPTFCLHLTFFFYFLVNVSSTLKPGLNFWWFLYFPVSVQCFMADAKQKIVDFI